MKFILSLFLIASILSCKADSNIPLSVKALSTQDSTKSIAPIPLKRTVRSIVPPQGFTIQKVSENSYGHYLQSLPLQPEGSKIHYFDGREKSYFTEYVAVLDLPIGTKDLHQCADAVMRLRADYLWNTQQYEKIHFNFTNGMRVDYSHWMQGQRIKVQGNNTNWYLAKPPSNTAQDYWKYLEQIWMYAGTLSLSKELKSREIEEVQIGDVFIQGGSPGHAVSIVNMAIHDTTGEKLVLLAQSYMPAQETHVLTNPDNSHLSPWYSMKELNILHTPEWTFNANDLKYFEN